MPASPTCWASCSTRRLAAKRVHSVGAQARRRSAWQKRTQALPYSPLPLAIWAISLPPPGSRADKWTHPLARSRAPTGATGAPGALGVDRPRTSGPEAPSRAGLPGRMAPSPWAANRRVCVRPHTFHAGVSGSRLPEWHLRRYYGAAVQRVCVEGSRRTRFSSDLPLCVG